LLVVTSDLVDRREALDRLSAAYERAAAGSPQLAVVWGRRRVGKTFLLTRFAEGKRTVFHAATEQAEPIELARLAAAVRHQLGEATADLAGVGFADWEAPALLRRAVD
jgi:AAA+ ATPase superfamily predicted ATPase